MGRARAYGSLSGANVSFDASTVTETDAALDALLSSQAPEASGLAPLDLARLTVPIQSR